MTDPILGEISIFAGEYAPRGWAFCDGSLLPKEGNDALYSLLENMYGGNATHFALPDLRGRVAIHRNDSYPQGVKAGKESVALSAAELPVHTHIAHASTPTDNNNGGPAGGFWAAASNEFGWGAAPGSLAMNKDSLAETGGGLAHENRIPVQAVNYIIAISGVLPVQN